MLAARFQVALVLAFCIALLPALSTGAIDLPSGNQADVLVRSRGLMSAGKYKEAEDCLLSALGQMPNTMTWNADSGGTLDYNKKIDVQSGIYQTLIECYVREKDLAKAEKIQDQMLSWRENLGRSDMELAGDYNEAALFWFKNGNAQRARNLLEHVFRMDSQFFEPYFNPVHENYRKVLLQLGDNVALQKFEQQVALAGTADEVRGSDNSKEHAFYKQESSLKEKATEEVTSGGGKLKQSVIDKTTAKAQPEEKPMNVDEARNYLLGLINRDRAKHHRDPVVLDEVATAAAQFHTDDSSIRGFSDHYDPEGRSPDWRYTLVGGTNMIAENNLGPYCDPKWTYSRPAAQYFTRKQLDDVESGFFNESPPNDGHRKNILERQHNRVGIGLTICNVTTPDGYGYRYVACCQEFMDSYGSFDHLPLSVKRGEIVTLQGKLEPGLSLYCVDVNREEFPRPIPLPKLRRNIYSSYGLPEQRIKAFWPGDMQMMPNGGFRLQVPVAASWQKGLYHFSVWVKDGKHDAFVVSRQIVAVDPDKPIRPMR